MIYKFECMDSNAIILLENYKNLSEAELQQIVRNVRFELGHHIFSDDIIKILCDKYDFNRINSIKF